MSKPKLRYKDFSRLGKNIIIKLRRNPNSIIVYPSSFDIDSVILYLKERGHHPNPRLDKTAQYFTDKNIDDILNSTVLSARIIRPKKW